MLIKMKSSSEVLPSEITSESAYLNRRKFLSLSSAAAVATVSPLPLLADSGAARFQGLPSRSFAGGQKITPFETASTYNNFYEFGTDKSDPARYAHEMTTKPWSVLVDGLVSKPVAYALDDLLGGLALEERIYRFRCVEAWSMVIPWVGFPLSALINKLSPEPSAKYIKFETLSRKSEMRGVRSLTSSIDWPYVEALRMDEAMNPLAFIAVGMYGRTLPNQNGAPLRLVVPWKYGFKSIKSIARISFADKQPLTSWEKTGPSEYGFYSNVNPDVNHPRWSQKTERRLPNSLFSPNRIDTLMFNGYAEQVASLYSGMDLAKYF